MTKATYARHEALLKQAIHKEITLADLCIRASISGMATAKERGVILLSENEITDGMPEHIGYIPWAQVYGRLLEEGTATDVADHLNLLVTEYDPECEAVVVILSNEEHEHEFHGYLIGGTWVDDEKAIHEVNNPRPVPKHMDFLLRPLDDDPDYTNYDVMLACAQHGLKETGERGIVVIDGDTLDDNVLFSYLPENTLIGFYTAKKERGEDVGKLIDDLTKDINEYDPETQVMVMFLDGDETMTVYKMEATTLDPLKHSRN